MRLKRIMIGLCVAFVLAAIGGGLWVWLGFRAAKEAFDCCSLRVETILGGSGSVRAR